jgi:hypothetical protein
LSAAQYEDVKCVMLHITLVLLLSAKENVYLALNFKNNDVSLEIRCFLHAFMHFVSFIRNVILNTLVINSQLSH